MRAVAGAHCERVGHFYCNALWHCAYAEHASLQRPGMFMTHQGTTGIVSSENVSWWLHYGR